MHRPGRGEKGAACRPRTAASGEASLAGTLAAEPWPPGPGGDEFCRVSPRPGASVIAALADFSRASPSSSVQWVQGPSLRFTMSCWAQDACPAAEPMCVACGGQGWDLGEASEALARV